MLARKVALFAAAGVSPVGRAVAADRSAAWPPLPCGVHLQDRCAGDSGARHECSERDECRSKGEGKQGRMGQRVVVGGEE